MTRRRFSGRLALIAGVLVLALTIAASAVADPGDPTSVALNCTPTSAVTGSQVSCAVTVTDTTTGTPTTPTGTVAVTVAAESPVECTLAAAGDGMTASCTAQITVPAGGDQPVSATYAGDDGHQGASGQTEIAGVDPTTTTLTCTPAEVSVGQTSSCRATVADPDGSGAITGTVSFNSSPASGGTLGTAGTCTLSTGSDSTSGTCPITFTATAAGTDSISAAYGGDDTHAPSTATSATVTVVEGSTTSFEPPAGTLAPGATLPAASGASAAALTLGTAARVSRAGVAAVPVTCAGASGTTCSGKLILSVFEAPVTVKAPTTKKPPTKRKSPTKRKRPKHPKAKARDALAPRGGQAIATQPGLVDAAGTNQTTAHKHKHKHKKKKTKTKKKKKVLPKPIGRPPVDKVIAVGSATYTVAAGASTTIDVQLSAAARRLLTAARGKLAVTALARGGSDLTGATVELTAQATAPSKHPPAKHSKQKQKQKQKKKKKKKTRPE